MEPSTEATPATLEAPPESAPPPMPPASAAPAPVDPPKGGRKDLFAARPVKSRWVTLPPSEDEAVGLKYLVAAVKPGEMAWISNQCFVRVPDPETEGAETIEWDGTKRGFLMVAIGLREGDPGRRMFPGSLEDPSQWLYGSQKVMDLDNPQYEALFTAVNDLSGFAKGAKEAAKKGSSKTRRTG